MRTGIPARGLLAKFMGALVGSVLLVFGFMFSLLVLAVAFGLALIIGVWFWWRTRSLRKEVHTDGSATDPDRRGVVIEGEAVVVEETPTRVTSNRSPASPDHH